MFQAEVMLIFKKIWWLENYNFFTFLNFLSYKTQISIEYNVYQTNPYAICNPDMVLVCYKYSSLQSYAQLKFWKNTARSGML